MKYDWKDLPDKKTVFTVRASALIDIETGKVIRHYSANTRIDVVQKCTVNDRTYYRTKTAATNNLNLAFEARDFGLPNEVAPSVPPKNSIEIQKNNLANASGQKEKLAQKLSQRAKDGEHGGLMTKIKQKITLILKK